ncbi:MAG: phenylalanine--tRNA ligase subunit beta [Syntrophobacteraceae bacterium]
MIVSLKWLRNYVDITMSAEDLGERLTMVGLEIEGIAPLHPSLGGVITARVDAVEKHPKADRLHLCGISDGRKSYRVVCGAPNVQEGKIVALALPGTRLPNGMTLEETRIRGELSQGMLCSQKELGLGEDASGIWLLDTETPVGVALEKALDIDDTIIDVSITPNRGDCLSMIGIAREVSAICGTPLRYPPVNVLENGPPVETLASVTIEDPVRCPRYAARVVRGITVGPSPAWLKKCLEAVGLRSINNIVDVTNFILMELGQPLHAFDYNRLHEHRIVVRCARGGERFTTLDGVERALHSDTLMICDGRGPVAVAGIMGGLDSEITAETKDVLIESAYFQPESIRRTGKKLGLRSESSYRFERGIDPEGVLRALDRAAQLMQEVGGGAIAAGRIDVYPEHFAAQELSLRVDRTNRYLGLRLSATEMAEILNRIEVRAETVDSGLVRVVPPSFRPDLTREVDLTEEIARLAGYDLIPVTYPKADVVTAPQDLHLASREEVKDLLKTAGYFEAISYSFVSQDSLVKLRLPQDDPRLRPIRLKNPLSEEQAVMRTSLLPGLLNAARYNFGHRNEDLRIFELSKVFLPREGESLPFEPHHLAGLAAGKRSPDLLYGGDAELDYTDVKGVTESVLGSFYPEKVEFAASDIPPYFDPFRAASVFVNGQKVGNVGRLHPGVEEAFDFKKPVYAFELDFDRMFELGAPRPLFRGLPKFPAVARDMALVVGVELNVREPLEFILSQGESLLESIEVFDIYQNPQFGEGKKSLGYRLVYRAPDRSLTDEEVNEVHGRLVGGVLDTFGVTLR